MALSDLSFKLYTDTSLTAAHSGTLQLTHETDLSDNPQDTVLYFGSAESAGTRTLQTTTSPGVNQITLTPTYILAEWAASTAYTLGQLREPTTPNNFKYKVVTAGTSAASEPTWPTSIGSQVTDGTVVWECLSATHPITEIKLATTSGGLAGATGGAALNLGTSVTSGTANKVEVHIRVTNTNTTVNDNTGYPELALYINEVQETEA